MHVLPATWCGVCAACRWDYAADERDCEIADLKRMLVEAEHKAKQATDSAAEDVAAANSELQVCPRASSCGGAMNK